MNNKEFFNVEELNISNVFETVNENGEVLIY